MTAEEMVKVRSILWNIRVDGNVGEKYADWRIFGYRGSVGGIPAERIDYWFYILFMY